MPRISTDNYDTVASWNGSQDLFIVEQPDGTKVATPAMVKQFIEAGDFEATGEVKDGNGNILSNIAGQVSDLNDEIDTKANLNSAISSSYVSINPASYGDPSHMYTAQHNMFLLIVFPYSGSAICRIRVTATDSFFYMQGANNTIIPLFIPKGMKFFFDSTTTVTDVRVYTDDNN